MWRSNTVDRSPALAAELLAQGVDVIVTSGTPPSLAAKTATSTIPIVFIVGDPVEIGLVASLARPGGNLTGVGLVSTELMPKRLEPVSELVPQAAVIALLVNAKNPIAERMMRDVQEAGPVSRPMPMNGSKGALGTEYQASDFHH